MFIIDRETAKAELKNREPDFLQKAKKRVGGKNTYVCPVCGNGSGATGDGLAFSNGHYKCFKCGLYEDIIGLWKIHNGIKDDKEAFNSLYSYYNLIITASSPTQNQKQNNIQNDTYTAKHTAEKDYTSYYKMCAELVSNTDYFKKRGLSEAVIKKFMLGYDPNYTKNTGGKVWQAVIIPTSKKSYVARNTDPKTDNEDRYRKQGTIHFFNKKCLEEAQKPIFIVEGELDALSIIEVGGEALALGSTANSRKFIELLKIQKPEKPLIIALDNDGSGEATSNELVKELETLNISFYRTNIYGDKKDANEALLADRENFKNAVSEVENIEKESNEAQKEKYLKTSTANYLQGFINGINESVNTPYIPTGFKEFDKELDGGLYEGLYIVGAISSLGKTTLVTQMADQIAEAGEDVLIFSLEMARSEIIAKSISRLTLLDVLQNNGDIKNAKTNRGITTGSRHLNYSKNEKELIIKAITAYGMYADKIYIHEGIGDIGTGQIREIVNKHILFTGRKPVVIIDYLQILAPADVRATDKQNTDKSVMELKRISRDFKIPVIGISSFNRMNYKTAVTMEAFKESGAIEYSSDVLIGLQLRGAGNKEFDVNEAKKKDPREIEVIILKNRNGRTGGKIPMNYYPKFNYFKEI